MTTRELAKLAFPIITNQEGSYHTVNRDDNGALSIGVLQWHGERALTLMKTICKAMNPISARSILGEKLYSEITSETTNWNNRIVNESELSYFQKFLSTELSKSIQLNDAISTVEGYINIGIANGIVDNQALIYFADIYNQSPARSLNIVKRLMNELAQFNKHLSLKQLHENTLIEPILGKYMNRRIAVYNAASNTVVTYIVVDGKQVKYSDYIDNKIPVKSNPNTTIQNIANEHGTKQLKISGYTGNSIVDALKFIGVDSSFSSRTNIYKSLGYTDTYTGSSEQNIKMLNKLRSHH